MTLLLFLASLGLMEYLVRKPSKKTDDPLKPADNSGAMSHSPPVSTSAASLLALGEALEAQGRGEVPDFEQVPEVHGQPSDGV